MVGKGRPESTFDADCVFAACAHFDKAVEINCRPERLDPPMRLLEEVIAAGCKVSIDTDAHAAGQLEWQPYGCERAAEAGVDVDSVVNSWPVDRLLEWTREQSGSARLGSLGPADKLDAYVEDTKKRKAKMRRSKASHGKRPNMGRG